MRQFIYFLVFLEFLCTKNDLQTKNSNKFFIEHQNTFDIQKTELCSPNDLFFLKQYYINHMYQYNISLLTSFDEINHKMCQKMVFNRQPHNIYLYQIHLGRTEYFNDKQQTCHVAIQFKEVTEQEKDQNTKTLQENGTIKYLQESALTQLPFVRKERCEKLLQNESDDDFIKRLKLKLSDKNIHEKIKYQMTLKIKQAPESFASTVLVPNDQLKDALSKEAYVRVLYEQFDCFALRLDSFKDVIEDKEEQVKQMVSQYLVLAQPAFKKLYQEQTKEFKQKLQEQLADKITDVAANKGAHQFMEQLCPNMSDDLTQGISKAIITFLFEIAFQAGTKVIGSIVNNTVGRIYRGLTGLFNRKKHADRDFKFCFNFEQLKLNDILQKKVHGILQYEVTVQDLASCMAEKIQIDNALLGYELRMQINSPQGLCYLDIFVNSAGVISYLHPEQHLQSCATFNNIIEGDQLNSIIQIDNEFNNKWDKQYLGQIHYDSNILNGIKSYPLQLDEMDLQDFGMNTNQFGKFQARDSEIDFKLRLI